MILELNVVNTLNAQISTLETKIDEIRASITSPRTSKINEVPSGNTASQSQIEDMTVRIDELERRLCNLREEKSIAMLDLTTEIYRRVSGKAGTVLCRRYIFGETFAEIATELCLSESRVRQIHCFGTQVFNGSAAQQTAKMVITVVPKRHHGDGGNFCLSTPPIIEVDTPRLKAQNRGTGDRS